MKHSSNRRGTGESGRIFASLGLAGFSLLALVSGCAVGPDYESPAAPEVFGYTENRLPEQTVSPENDGSGGQAFLMGAEVVPEWWTLFGSERLNQLVAQALQASPSLQAAEARLRQAQESLYAQKGSLAPSAEFDSSVTRRKFSGASYGQPEIPSTIFTLYNASVGVSYNLDLFGGTRRAIEAMMARVEAREYERQAAYLSLTANVVTNAIREASLRGRISETLEIAAAQENRLQLMEQELAFGSIAKSAVIAQEAKLAETRAALPPLRKQLAQTRNQMATLIGQTPGAGFDETFELSELRLPLELPVSLPSHLVRQRPDIGMSEALLHAASAEVGVATANLFPQITISGSYGGAATELSELTSSDTSIWNIGAGLTQPLFRGGALKRKKRAAVAAFDEAAADYRSAVLRAFQNTADSLDALRYDAETLAAQTAAEQAAARRLAQTEQAFEIGAANYLELLEAQSAHREARVELIETRALRLADTVALFQSLGGGWWNRD